MANWYVRTDGSDANTGAGNTAALACQTVNGALGKAVAAGDTVYVAPGVYRQLIVMTASGSAGNVISLIADVDASHFDGTVGPGECVLTAYVTNDATAPGTTVATIDLATKSYLTIDGFTVVGSGFTGEACVKANTVHSRGITLRRCTFLWKSTGAAILYTNTPAVPADWAIDRCAFLGAGCTGNAITIVGADPAQAGDLDLNFTVQNCLIDTAAGTAIGCTAPGTATGGGKPGGVRMRNCTVISKTGMNAGGANLSTTIPLECYNSILMCQTSLQATTSGSLVNDYCDIVGGLTNVTAGAHSQSGTTLAPLAHVGQEVAVGRATRPYLGPAAGSPYLNFGNGGASPAPPTVDFLNRPRPAGGFAPAIGYMERHDSAVSGGAANADGGTGDCLKLVGPSDHDLYIAVDSGVSVTIAIKQKTSAYVGAAFPQITLLANAEIGVAAQTVADTAAHTSYTTLTLASITPTANGVVTLRLQNLTGDGAGIVYFDTASIS